MNEILHSAIVGCGAIAQTHAAVLSVTEGARLAACADILPERAKKMADKYDCRAYDSLDAMLDSEKIDVLHVCTPHALHTPMIENAVRRGIAVLTEKPPAATDAQWDRLCALPKEAFVGICLQNRYNPETRALKTLLEEKTLGEIKGARAFVTWQRDQKYYESGAWRGTWREAGGGALINQAVHTLDLMVYLLGAPTASRTRMENRHLRGVIEVEDTVESYIRFGEVTGLFYASTAYAGNAPVMLDILCERGTARLEPGSLEIIRADGTRERETFSRPEPLGKSYWGNGHVPYIDDFYARLRAGQRPAVGIKEADATVRLLLNMYKDGAAALDRPTQINV